MSQANHAVEVDRLTLVELMQQYGSEDACHEALEELRWPDGVACPKCGSVSISRIKKRRQYDCGGCRHQFSVREERSFTTPSCRSGSGRVCAAMREESPAPLTGHVEIDETYVGGKNFGKGQEMRLSNKVHVAGAVERGGRVRMRVVPNLGLGSLRPFYGEVIADDAHTIYSDQAWDEGQLADENTRHRTVNHSKYQWVLPDDVHTNTIEGVWRCSSVRLRAAITSSPRSTCRLTWTK